MLFQNLTRRVGAPLLCVLVVAGISRANAQTNETDAQGIPIDSPTVLQACGSCHRPDDAGRLSRISFRRTTPEGWQQTIRRMVSLNGVELPPDTAREVVRYLSNTLGLAPEEAHPAAYEVERRADDQPYADATIQEICTQCHSMGRVLSQRRTEEEWSLLMAMHRGYYPFTDFQAFRRSGPATGEPQPVDQAISHLSARFPFETPEWTAWSATMRPARVAGTWVLRGHALGLGPVYGSVTINPVPNSADEFTTTTTYVYARTGRQVTRTGQALIYTGFQWRGRSSADNGDVLREVMFVDRNLRTMHGRWFTGAYDEDGLDITLERIGGQPVVAGDGGRSWRWAGWKDQNSRPDLRSLDLPGVPSGRSLGNGAPRRTHSRRIAISGAGNLALGGICRSAFRYSTASINRLCCGFFGINSGPESPPRRIAAARSSRSPPSMGFDRCEWHL